MEIDISIQNMLRLRLQNGKEATVVLHDPKSFKAFEKQTDKRYPKENGIELVKLKNGGYAHLIYPESPLYKEIKKMIADQKQGKELSISKDLEKLLFGSQKNTLDKQVDFGKFTGKTNENRNTNKRNSESPFLEVSKRSKSNLNTSSSTKLKRLF